MKNLALMLVLCFVACGSEPQNGEPIKIDGNVTYMLRPRPDGSWRFLTEGNHAKPDSVLAVDTYDNRLVVTSNYSFVEVYGFVCSVDNILIKYDITCGISGGDNISVITFHKYGVDGEVDPRTLNFAYSNITISVFGYHEQD